MNIKETVDDSNQYRETQKKENNSDEFLLRSKTNSGISIRPAEKPITSDMGPSEICEIAGF
ncbi:MAG: hypothetical protein FWC09_08360 [Lachnospiraceae bacterium]|nr:hypothetical protein [Lachnospiraceae bacterium]